MSFLVAQLESVPGVRDLGPIAPAQPEGLVVNALELLNTYVPVFLVAFATTLILTPIVRRIAVKAGVIDHPDRVRKEHEYPIAYLGGLAIFFGVFVGIAASYVLVTGEARFLPAIPIEIAVGMVAITLTGLLDDIWKLYPRLKIAGQLVAAAALAQAGLGTQIAQGALFPLLGAPAHVLLETGFSHPFDALTAGHVYYAIGVALLAFFVIGACNAANLIDGLDGLLSGSVAIMAVGFLIISLLMAAVLGAGDPERSFAAARVALSLALLGAVLGFLPYNFNPAVIFLGDAGSLTLGYLSITLILMFGEEAQTPLVLAGLIVFAVPIMDTMLAIVRRRLAGVSFSQADANHIHHQLKRSLGSVKRAVLALYAITGFFTMLGVAVAAMRLLTGVRIMAIYALAIVFFAFIAAVAIKTARRGAWTIAAVRDERRHALETAEAAAMTSDTAKKSEETIRPSAPALLDATARDPAAREAARESMPAMPSIGNAGPNVSAGGGVPAAGGLPAAGGRAAAPP